MQFRQLTSPQKPNLIFPYPLNNFISVIVPVYNVEPKWLNRCINSVLNQYYIFWELCIYDDSSTNSATIDTLKKWKEKDKRIKINFGKKNKGISLASNEAIKMATGKYIALLDNDDELTNDALLEVAKRIKSNPNLKFIYSDEDIIEMNGTPSGKHYKSDFNLDLFLSNNYICHFTVIKKSLCVKVGCFRKGYEGAQDYDLFLRCIEKIRFSDISHIPKILYHWRKMPGSSAVKYSNKKNALKSSIKALEGYLCRNRIKGKVLKGRFHGTFRIKRDIIKEELVTIIVPFRDKVELIKTCINSLLEKTEYKNFEILLVNNGSKEKKTTQYLDRVIKKDRRVILYDYNHPFNYSAINNWAVNKARGKYILFLNNDTRVIAKDWLTAMVEHIQRKEVGAVGAKLLYKNNTIQHAGVVLSNGGAEHIFRHYGRNDSGFLGQLNLTRNCSVSTGACLLIRRNLFLEIGGFDEKHLKMTYNDVDLCLKIREKGYLIVYTPYAELYHYESISRGDTDTEKKIRSVKKELKFMQNKWKDKLFKDPFLNPNLSISHSEELKQFLQEPHISHYEIYMNMFDVKHNTGETIGSKHFCFTTKHKKGHCVYGPGIRFPKKIILRATFYMEFINIFEEEKNLINIDIYDSKNDKILVVKNISFHNLKSIEEEFSLEFEGKKSQVLEFRVYWYKNCDLAVSKIVLEKK